MNDKFGEFKEECLEEDGAKRLDRTQQEKEAKRFKNQSEYHRQAAEDLLQGESSLIAIVEGYYSMLHKANQALALAGFKTSSHKCTLLGLRGVFKNSELARQLQQAMDERINVDYYIDPEKEDTEFTDPEHLIKNKTDPFIQDINQLIEKEL
jgi:uncharacterized protein (UPF0332 family)